MENLQQFRFSLRLLPFGAIAFKKVGHEIFSLTIIDGEHALDS